MLLLIKKEAKILALLPGTLIPDHGCCTRPTHSRGGEHDSADTRHFRRFSSVLLYVARLLVPFAQYMTAVGPISHKEACRHGDAEARHNHYE